MNSIRSWLIGSVAAILVLLSFGWSFWAYRQNRHVQIEFAQLSNRQTALTAFIAREEQARLNRPATKAPQPVKAPAPAPKRAKPQAKPDFDAIMSEHPELLTAFEKGYGGYLDETFGPLFTQLNLPRDQIDRLEALIISNAADQFNLNAKQQALGLPDTDPVISQDRAQLAADFKGEAQDLLGQQNYAAFDAAFRTEGVRSTVSLVSSMAAFSDAPLTRVQSDQLRQLIAQSSADYRNGSSASETTVDWDAVQAQAPTFLGASQLAALQAQIQLEQFARIAKSYSQPAATK